MKPDKLLFGLLLIWLLALANQSQAAIITYDFRSAAAQTALDGLVSGTFTVDGVPLGVEAGTTDTAGSFVSGVDTLSIDLMEGLGVNGEQLRDVHGGLGLLTTAVQFTLNPSFVVDTITLERYFSEDLVVFADGSFLGGLLPGIFNDFPLAVLDPLTGLTEVTLGPLPGISTLLITTSVEFDDDSDFFIASLKGVAVPEPPSLIVYAFGLAGLGFIRQCQGKSA